MSLLTSPLPDFVLIDGAEYLINTDFRVSIAFEEIILSGRALEQEAMVKALQMYYPDIPLNITAAVERLLWFYQCGEEGEKGAGVANSKRIYSFEYDSEYIYAAFLDQYGIDLQETNLHWWKFKALFHALKEDNQIVKIMGYRAVSITNKMSKEQKDFYRSMKKQYEIPVSKSEREKLDSIQSVLLNGGDLSKF